MGSNVVEYMFQRMSPRVYFDTSVLFSIGPDECIDCGAASQASAEDIERNAEGARLIRLRGR